MIKSDLVWKIAQQNPHLYQRDVQKIIDIMFGEITTAMARDDRVELRGFGTFSIRKRSPRTARNPRTGALVSVEKKAFVYFKTGKQMRSRLNRSRA
jgi:integration host factor subunit beta